MAMVTALHCNTNEKERYPLSFKEEGSIGARRSRQVIIGPHMGSCSSVASTYGPGHLIYSMSALDILHVCTMLIIHWLRQQAAGACVKVAKPSPPMNRTKRKPLKSYLRNAKQSISQPYPSSSHTHLPLRPGRRNCQT